MAIHSQKPPLDPNWKEGDPWITFGPETLVTPQRCTACGRQIVAGEVGHATHYSGPVYSMRTLYRCAECNQKEDELLDRLIDEAIGVDRAMEARDG